MALIGYARVSTGEQNLDMQIDALLRAGCSRENIYTDKESGAVDNRSGLMKALAALQPGSCLVVWKLCRLSRSVNHLIATVTDLRNRNIDFKSLTETIDTSSPGGKLIFVIFSALAEFERDIIRARTKAGLESARARGRIGGRPNKLMSDQILMAQRLLEDPQHSVSSICKTLGISRATLYRNIKK